MKQSYTNRAVETLSTSVSIFSLLGSHRHGMSASLVSAIDSNMPLIIVGYVKLSAVDSFAMIDRVIKQINTGVSPLFDVLRGWVPRGGRHEVERRSRFALKVIVIMSCFMSVLLYFVAPTLVQYLSHGAFVPDALTSLAFAMMFGVSLIATIQGQIILVSNGLIAQLSRNVTLSSIASLPLIALLAFLHGTVGAIAGIVIGRLVLLGLNTISLRFATRSVD